jgi:hypothetical protein
MGGGLVTKTKGGRPKATVGAVLDAVLADLAGLVGSHLAGSRIVDGEGRDSTGRPVRPSDVAVLVTTAAVAEQVRAALVAVGIPALTEANKYKAPLGVLSAHGTQVESAKAVTPHQWQHWWWVCVAGEIVFLPLILLMVGRWRPKKAKKDAEDHEREVTEELARLGLDGAAGG